MPRTEVSGQSVCDGFGELVCGMLCYLNIIPIISKHLQTATTEDVPEDLPYTFDALLQKSEIERGLKIQENLKEEIQLQKDMLEK